MSKYLLFKVFNFDIYITRVKVEEKCSRHKYVHTTFLVVFFFFLEANPEKFNSRFRNKMFYAGVSARIMNVMFYVWHFTGSFLCDHSVAAARFT